MKQRSTHKKRMGLSLLFSFLFFTSFGQISITDTGNCLNHVLHATVTGTIPTSSGITLDDGYSGLIPIGFTFNFYGTNYTSLVIGSNGVLNFTASLAGAFCPWSIGSALLGNANMRNAICGPWCDMCMPCAPTAGTGGSITYSTIGTAPNRRFAVTWCGDAMFSCGTQWTTSQIIIDETTNVIEVHTAHKTICAWNGGYAITGVQNAAGTLATVAPGRDFPANWTVLAPAYESWRFTSTGPSYTVTSIPYAPAPYATSAIYWYDSSTGAYISTGPYLTVTPSVPTTYTAVALGCGDSTKAYIHVGTTSTGTFGGIPHITSYTYTHPTECGKCDGSITITGVNPGQIDTVFWSIGGVAQTPLVRSALPDSTITLTDLCGGVYDYIYVKVGDCPSNQVGPITLITPILAVSHSALTHPTVCGAFDGTITLYGLTPYKPYSVTYTRNGVGQGPLTGIVASDSSITITGLDSAIYSSFAVTIGYCTAPWTTIVLVDPAPITPSFTFDLHPGCNGDTVFVTNTTTPSGYHSYWNYESGATMDSLHTWHVYNTQLLSPRYVLDPPIVLTYNTTAFHKANCAATATLTPHIDHHIIASFTQDRDTLCLGIPIVYTNTTSSANPATYRWEFGDYTSSTDVNPTHIYSLPATAWTTTLTATDSVLGCTDYAYHTSNVVLVTLDLPADTSVCLRDSMMLRSGELSVIGFTGDIAYHWTMEDGSVGTNLSNYDIETPYFFGIGDFPYKLEVTVVASALQGAVCTASDTRTIHSFPPITFTGVTASPQVIMYGSSIHLNAMGATYYTWTPNNGTLDNPNINNPVATPTDSVTHYIVHGMTEYGCADSTEVTVYVDYDNTDYIPTGFTPNGDGKNDKFHPVKFRFQKLVEMRVYNRWGQVLFQSSNPEDGWDGTFNGVPQDIGSYNYEVIVARADGSQKVYKGSITLIR